MKGSYYRGRTPLVKLFYELNGELELAEKVVHRFGWLTAHCYGIQATLKRVDEPLAREMMLILEGHPAAPFGLSGLDIEGMSLCRAVDRFQAILVAFVGEVFKSNPETLLDAATNMRVDAVEVLNCGTFDEFRQFLAARKLRQLGGFSEVRRFIRKLGVNIKLDKESEHVINEAIAVRNITVHNGGRVDEQFRRITGRKNVQIDEKVRIDRDMFIRAVAALRLAADTFQIALGEKYFGLGKSLISATHVNVFSRTTPTTPTGKAKVKKE